VRTFAFRGLRGVDKPAVAKAIVQHLDHPDPEVRREAEAAVLALGSGRAELLSRHERSKDPVEAARWSAILLQAPGPTDPATDKGIESRAMRWIERGDFRAADAVHLLRRARGEAAFDLLLARARSLRRAKKWKEALAFYRLVERDRRFGAEDRFDLAVAELHLGESNPSPDRRAADPALSRFSSLLSRDGFPLVQHVKREKSLAPRQLYYVGFHFSESASPPERSFGGEVLRLLVERSPRTAEGKAAKNKLRREVLL
jgi:hypothetical protein